MLLHAESQEFVDESLVREPFDALELVSAAVFRCIGERFERVSAIGWPANCIASMFGSDTLIVHLRAELEPLDLSTLHLDGRRIPDGLAQPLVALPLVVRHELLGFALYSGHRGGEALDPDEIAALQRLVHAAAGAYDHIEAMSRRRRIETLEGQNAELRHGEELVRQMLEALRGEASGVES